MVEGRDLVHCAMDNCICLGAGATGGGAEGTSRFCIMVAFILLVLFGLQIERLRVMTSCCCRSISRKLAADEFGEVGVSGDSGDAGDVGAGEQGESVFSFCRCVVRCCIEFKWLSWRSLI